MDYSNYLELTGVLIVISLFLDSYEPPIKRQNIALIVMAFGLTLGWLMVENLGYGFLIAGLVFFKDELINEASLISQCITKFKLKKENSRFFVCCTRCEAYRSFECCNKIAYI